MGPHPKPRKLTVRTFTPAPNSYASKVRAKIAADPNQPSPTGPLTPPAAAPKVASSQPKLPPPKPTRSAAPPISSATVQGQPAKARPAPAIMTAPEVKPPDQAEAIVWRKDRSEALAWLQGAYPALMGPPGGVVKPLPLRFGELVCARAFAAGHAVSAFKAALARHCRSIPYLEAIAAPESMRHDLDGAATGPVNPSHRAYAAKSLAEIEAKAAGSGYPRSPIGRGNPPL